MADILCGGLASFMGLICILSADVVSKQKPHGISDSHLFISTPGIKNIRVRKIHTVAYAIKYNGVLFHAELISLLNSNGKCHPA